MVYSINKRESNRITCLRAICVGLVIFLHQYAGDLEGNAFVASGSIPGNEVLQSIQYIISRIITCSAVPLFFMLSSVLLYAKEFTWKSNMKKKLKSVILPYILWITLYIIAYFLGQTLPMTSSFFANAGRKVSDMSIMDYIGAYTGVGGHGLFVNAMWFLRDLVILNLIAPLVKKLIDRFPLICLVLIALLWNMGSVPSMLILNKQSIVFFALGYFIVKYGLHMNEIDRLNTMGILFLYVITIMVEFYFYKVGSEFRVAAHSFTVVIGIMLLLKFSGTLIKTEETKIPRMLKTVATYSFFVYVSHDFVQTLLKKITIKLLTQTEPVQMMEYFIIPLLACGICIGEAVLLKRFVPSIYSALTGARK